MLLTLLEIQHPFPFSLQEENPYKFSFPPFYDEKLELRWREEENNASTIALLTMHICSHALKTFFI
jgi:hypothetical protein